MHTVKCPHCNTHDQSIHAHTSIMICRTCHTPLLKKAVADITTQKIQLAQKPAEQFENLLGRSFWLDYNTYKITGYIRYFYSEGYMYQWAAYNHNRFVWLCECMGNWFLLVPEKECTDIDVKKLRPGNTFTYQKQTYTVDALSLFYNYYAAGELPDFMYTHNKGISIECSNKDHLLVHFNIFSDDVIEMYTGRNINFKDLKMNVS